MACTLHDGSQGVHLMAADCPSAACYQCSASLWSGSTTQQVQASANQALAADGVAVTVQVASVNPLIFSATLT
jgi:hypothetical protein